MSPSSRPKIRPISRGGTERCSQQGHGADRAKAERERRQRAAEHQRGTENRRTQAAAHQDRAHGGGQH